MNRKVLMIALVGLIGLSYYFLANGQSSDNCVVGSKEVKESTKNEVQIIDVRTPNEYNSGHVDGARLIDVNSPDFKNQISQLDKDKSYYVYCKAGVRSGNAQKIMQEMGFKNVCNVSGGVTKLQSEGVKLVN